MEKSTEKRGATKVVVLLTWFVILMIGWSGCSTVKETVSEPPDMDPILRVGFSPGPPQLLNAADENDLKGLEIDLITLFAKKNNYFLETSVYPRDELFFALRRGEIDIAVPAATDTIIAENFLLPCAPHLKTGQRILVNKAVSMFIKDREQLNNDKITVLTPVGSTSANFAKEVLPSAHNISLKDIKSCIRKTLTYNGNIMMLDAGDAWTLQSKKFVFNPKEGTEAGEKVQARLKVVLAPLTSEQIAWAVRNSDQERMKALNLFIQNLKKNGKLQEMIESHSADIINE